jgi:hypothetical protein
MTARVLGALGACFFGWSAALQWNDPDPLRWLALYLASAALCGAAPYRALPPALPIGLGALALVWAATLAPEVARTAAWSGTELERELGGLLLVAGVAGAWARHLRGRASGSARLGPG